ncbi:MAG: YabP/YqfC family sporulation protein [Clostridia bacterium]|nr:YabP/YqfC family sporulation protein [Clostridia bacterium]
MSKKRREEVRRGERAGIRERMTKSLDLPPDLLGGGWIEIRGRNEVTVKGCGKILLYTPEEIRVGFGKDCLSVRGKRLVCTSYYVGAVGIEGYICGLSFEEA